MKGRRLAGWLVWLVPPLTVAAILHAGRLLAPPEAAPLARSLEIEVAAPERPEQRDLRILLRRADGSPAEGALVVLVEPFLAVAHAGPEGVAQLWGYGAGEYRLEAWVEGHRLLAPPSFVEAPEAGFQFASLDPQKLEPVSTEVRVLRLLQLRGRDGTPLEMALVKAWPTDWAQPVPWLALSGSGGEVYLEGTRPCQLRIEVFAPLMPPRAPWQLATIEIGPEDGVLDPMELEFDWARLELQELPLDTVLAGERLDMPAPMPLVPVAHEAELRFDGLPPGRYRFRAGGGVLEVELVPGRNQAAFPLAVPAPVLAPQGS